MQPQFVKNAVSYETSTHLKLLRICDISKTTKVKLNEINYFLKSSPNEEAPAVKNVLF